ncbi:MAG: HAMP domain-containing protein [Zetaproteobacteria bacterium]|nr:HAMP domain-containing protein [Zetaproteobacteria bacterium]
MLYVVVELTILLIAGLLIYSLLSRQVYNDVDEELYAQAQSVVNELNHSDFTFWPFHVREFTNHFNGSVQLVDTNGDIQFTFGKNLLQDDTGGILKALKQAMTGRSIIFVSTETLLRADNMRVIAAAVRKDNEIVGVLLLGRNTQEIQKIFKLLYSLGGFLGLLSIVISCVVGYMMARRALKPIGQITATAKAVSSGDLTRRLDSDVHDKEIRELITSLNSMFEDLESNFNAQKRFTADASHELRIPLTILKGEVEVALRHPRSEEEYKHLLGQHLDIIERMQRIVNDLLTLARADAGLLEVVQKPVDLSLLLQEIAQHHLILFDDHKIQLEMDIDDDLEILADAGHIERIVFNLLNNAFKFAPRNSTIYLSAHVYENEAVIMVKDQGLGISPDQQKRLFDRFYRVDDARARQSHHHGGGAGLGLAICKRIVEAHGGAIRVESALGKGAAFFVHLPLNRL